jgi:hypothetical protein
VRVLPSPEVQLPKSAQACHFFALGDNAWRSRRQFFIGFAKRAYFDTRGALHDYSAAFLSDEINDPCCKLPSGIFLENSCKSATSKVK